VLKKTPRDRVEERKEEEKSRETNARKGQNAAQARGDHLRPLAPAGKKRGGKRTVFLGRTRKSILIFTRACQRHLRPISFTGVRELPARKNLGRRQNAMYGNL